MDPNAIDAATMNTIDPAPPRANGSGPDSLFDLCQILSRPLEIDLASKLSDGLPARIRMKQQAPAVWARVGRGFPIVTGRSRIEIEDPGAEDEANKEWHEFARLVLEIAVIAAQEVVHRTDGLMERIWRPVKLVPPGREAQEGEIPTDLFDVYDNVRRAFTLLITDFNEGGLVGQVATGQGFRQG